MTAFLIFMIGLALLFIWGRDRANEIQAKTEERQRNCPHPPEMQETVRVNSIITLNAALIHRVIPGRRHLTKRCRACGKYTDMYKPSYQPWNEFKAEYDQETIDREAQYKARWNYEEARRKHEKEKNERAKQSGSGPTD